MRSSKIQRDQAEAQNPVTRDEFSRVFAVLGAHLGGQLFDMLDRPNGGAFLTDGRAAAGGDTALAFSAKAAAKKLGISLSTLKNYRAKGLISPSLSSGSRPMYSLQDFEDLLAALSRR
jgi:hypothetical protein